MPPLISICIPAYKNVFYLQRLLQSISVQTFTDFEVIVTDDSNDNTVAAFLKTNDWPFSLGYYKNEKALGSPENWNAAVGRAQGEWIKLMHDDDWFSTKTSLQVFAQQIQTNAGHNFFYCAYHNVYEDGTTAAVKAPSKFWRQRLLRNPVALLAANIIGPPSATIYRNNKVLQYDKRLKWLVDMDFYISYFKTTYPVFIPESLINIGIHSTQITQASFRKPEIEIPEHLIVLQKAGDSNLNNPIVYDAFWRLFRNLKIRSVADLERHNKWSVPLSTRLVVMLKHQNKVPGVLLKTGVLSKISMLFSWLLNRS